MAMSFRAAMDKLGLTAAEVARALDRTTQHVKQMRLDPGNVNYRAPPTGWQRKLAALARSRSRAAAKVADQLDRA